MMSIPPHPSLPPTLVTVIIPVYNGMPYLPEAVESVHAQTLSDWHLLLVDDLSSDGSVAYLQTLADERHTIVQHEQNRGLYPTLNEAIAMARSRWIVILMQDDHLKANHLETLLALSEEHPDVGGLWGMVDIINEKGDFRYHDTPSDQPELVLPSVQTWAQGLLRGAFWIISGSMTKRDLLMAMPFREDLPHAADFEWILRCQRTVPMYYSEKILTEIRIHEGQASHGNILSARDHADYFKIISHHVREYAGDLSVQQMKTIVAFWVRQCARRFLTALYRRRPGTIPVYIRLIIGYLTLLREHPRVSSDR